jgi:hypothetical protein
VRIILEPGLARRAGVSPTDAAADFGDGQLGIFLADLP